MSPHCLEIEDAAATQVVDCDRAPASGTGVENVRLPTSMAALTNAVSSVIEVKVNGRMPITIQKSATAMAGSIDEL